MRNDFKMIVFKQLTISIKTQNDNKIKVSCRRINKMLHYTVNMTINTVGTLNLSTEFGALFGFFLHLLRRLIFFLQEMRPQFSMLNAKRFEVVYILHHLYIMYSNVKTPPVTLCNYQPVAWVLYQRVIDQSKADIFIKPGIIVYIIL